MANTYQSALFIKSRLEALVWGGGDNVFGKVLVTAGVDVERTRSQLRWPFCLILPDSMDVDEEEPDLVTQRFVLLVAQSVANDPWGETVIIGGASDGTGLTSPGRGILEIEQRLYDVMQLASEQDGIRIQLISASAIAAEFDVDIGYVAQRQYTFEVWTGVGFNP